MESPTYAGLLKLTNKKIFVGNQGKGKFSDVCLVCNMIHLVEWNVGNFGNVFNRLPPLEQMMNHRPCHEKIKECLQPEPEPLKTCRERIFDSRQVNPVFVLGPPDKTGNERNGK